MTEQAPYHLCIKAVLLACVARKHSSVARSGRSVAQASHKKGYLQEQIALILPL